MDHLYLRNQTGTDSHFYYARGRDNDAEEVVDRPVTIVDKKRVSTFRASASFLKGGNDRSIVVKT